MTRVVWVAASQSRSDRILDTSSGPGDPSLLASTKKRSLRPLPLVDGYQRTCLSSVVCAWKNPLTRSVLPLPERPSMLTTGLRLAALARSASFAARLTTHPIGGGLR